MVQKVKGFGEHYAGFRRHLTLAIAVFSVIMVFGVGFSLSLPDVYRASSTVLIEDPDIPNAIIRTTVTSYTGRELTMLTEKILTFTNLVALIKKFNLYPEARKDTPVELLAMPMREKIAVDVQSRESISEGGMPSLRVVGFSVSFEDENPEVTKLVVDELTAKYLEENIKLRSEQTADTNDFIEGEIRTLEAEITKLESEMAAFKLENRERLPSMNAMNASSVTRMDETMRSIDQQLDVVEQNRGALVAQLATVESSIAVRLQDGTYALSPSDQLKSLQTQLTLYETRYSDDHPDVIMTKRDIASIKERFGVDAEIVEIDNAIAAAQADLVIAEGKYSEEHPDVVGLKNTIASLKRDRSGVEQSQIAAQSVPDNPAYIVIQTSIDRLDSEEIILKKARIDAQKQMNGYMRRIEETPQVETEMATMGRTLSSTSNRYWIMRDKQFQTSMGETLELKGKSETMTLLEPARVPMAPFKPNRGAIIMLTLLFAFVAGVGITQLVDGLDRSIYSTIDVIAVQGVAPLIEIPYIVSDEDAQRAVKRRKMTMVGVPGLIVITILIVYFFLQPQV
jgi:succinoglycan biosynthesis transport protein ExoP